MVTRAKRFKRGNSKQEQSDPARKARVRGRLHTALPVEGATLAPVMEESIQREKARGRLLRATQWWKRKRSLGICYYCQKPARPSDLSMDHIVPLARGGRSVKTNIVPACKACNNKKKALLPMEWEGFSSAAGEEL